MDRKIYVPVLLTFIWLCACNSPNSKKEGKSNIPTVLPELQYRFISYQPHDTTSFTEGLVFYQGKLFESTGSPDDLPFTRSLIGPVDQQTGRIDAKIELDKKQYFGEGITFLNDSLFQLTYKSQTGFIYDARHFSRIGSFEFKSKEGWGLTTDGNSLIMSDGTEKLTYINPGSFKVEKVLNVVSENGLPQTNLNELEWINGFIYANIFTTNQIVRIDPESGNIVARADLQAFNKDAKSIYPGSLEMNGIAFDPETNRVFLTGKLWPRIYVIELL